MNHYLLKLTALLITIFAATTLVRATPSSGISIKRLHPAFGDKERVSSFQLSPDEATVVFYAGDFSKNSYALQAAPRRAGSAPITISRPEDTGRVGQYAIAPDSQTVIYSTRTALIAAALDGSAAQTITLPLSQTSNIVTESIKEFWIADDQQTVVYEITTYPMVYERLMSVRLDGSAPVELVGHGAPFNSGVTVEGFADGRVLYRLLQKSTLLHLLSIPVQGGQPLVLTSELASNQYVRGGVQISPDQQTVAFLMGDPADQYFSAAYEARLDGSGMTRLSDPAHTKIQHILISPDSQSILYIQALPFESFQIQKADLYRVARGGGPATRLNGAVHLRTNDYTPQVEIAPDSQRVVFLAKDWSNSNGGYQVFSAPLAGGPTTTLSGHGASQFVIAQNGQSVAYIRTQAADPNTNGLYRISINGGASTLLSGFLADKSSLMGMSAPGGGHNVVAIQRVYQASHTFYAFDLRYGTAKVLNPAPFAELYFYDYPKYTVARNGDVVFIAEVVGSAVQEELFVSIREDVDPTVQVFLPLVQR